MVILIDARGQHLPGAVQLRGRRVLADAQQGGDVAVAAALEHIEVEHRAIARRQVANHVENDGCGHVGKVGLGEVVGEVGQGAFGRADLAEATATADEAERLVDHYARGPGAERAFAAIVEPADGLEHLDEALLKDILDVVGVVDVAVADGGELGRIAVVEGLHGNSVAMPDCPEQFVFGADVMLHSQCPQPPARASAGLSVQPPSI